VLSAHTIAAVAVTMVGLPAAPAWADEPRTESTASPAASLRAPLGGRLSAEGVLQDGRRELREARIQRGLYAEHARLKREVADARAKRVDKAGLRAARTWRIGRLQHVNEELQRKAGSDLVAVPAHLEAIASCESGGDPRAIGGGGAYRGKYQFDMGRWTSVGGKGDPAAAPEAEQDRRAAILYAQAGASPWPACGS